MAGHFTSPAPPQASPRGAPPETILTRRDFLACARSGRKHVAPGMIVQARERADMAPLRVGYTCSKKLGNAVARNRAKRRLREVARAVLPGLGIAGWDYVLIGRPGGTIARPFAELTRDLEAALKRLHKPRRAA